jgi:hypothetical protein
LNKKNTDEALDGIWMQEDAVEEYLSCLVDVQERTLDVPLVKDYPLVI